LLQALENTGHSGDTLFLFLSDNGCPWPGAKTTLYEAGMRLPLVVRLPGEFPKGVATDAMVTWADLTPTILDYAGVARPGYALHGRSFLSVLKQPDQPGWDEIYASHTFHEITMYYPMRVIRTRRYKYILNLAHELPYPFASDLYDSPTWQAALSRGEKLFGSRSLDAYIHRPRHELYDLKADPQELHNLAEQPEQQGLLKDLQRRLRAWQEKTKDPWVVKYQYE
jgi:N-sulfoglucosamine sulfohydrolase